MKELHEKSEKNNKNASSTERKIIGEKTRTLRIINSSHRLNNTASFLLFSFFAFLNSDTFCEDSTPSKISFVV